MQPVKRGPSAPNRLRADKPNGCRRRRRRCRPRPSLPSAKRADRRRSRARPRHSAHRGGRFRPATAPPAPTTDRRGGTSRAARRTARERRLDRRPVDHPAALPAAQYLALRLEGDRHCALFEAERISAHSSRSGSSAPRRRSRRTAEPARRRSASIAAPMQRDRRRQPGDAAADARGAGHRLHLQVRASRRALRVLLSMRCFLTGIRTIPDPEEAAKQPSRRGGPPLSPSSIPAGSARRWPAAARSRRSSIAAGTRPGCTSLNTMRTRVPMPTRCTCRAAPACRPACTDCRRRAAPRLGRLALLRVEIDQQDQVGRVLAEGRLDRVVHLAVGVHRALALDLLPGRFRASCTTGRRWSADSAAGRIRRRPADGNRAPRSGGNIRGSRCRDRRRAAAPMPDIRRE